VAEAASPVSAVQHFSQNLDVGLFSAVHFGQRLDSGLPHSALSVTYLIQRVHLILRDSHGCPLRIIQRRAVTSRLRKDDRDKYQSYLSTTPPAGLIPAALLPNFPRLSDPNKHLVL
jgi:hypothetical protein